MLPRAAQALVGESLLGTALRGFSTATPAAPAAAPAGKTTFGNLKDEDRIFTNIYGRHDPFIKVRASFREASAAAWLQGIVVGIHLALCAPQEGSNRFYSVFRCCRAV